VTFRVCRQKI